MRVLVTGAAGFIGSHVAEQLLADGHEVVGIDAFVDYYPREHKQQNLRAALAHPKFEFRQLDLKAGGDALASALEGVEAVIHEAAMPGLQRSWTEYDSYLANNMQASQRLFEASVRSGVRRIVHASTSSVYGRYAVGDEQMPTRPISPYGVTKLAAEHLALAYMDSYGLPVVILRYFSVYGPRQRPDMAYHIFCESLLDGRPLTIYGDGHQTRSSTYVSDCVQGTIDALLRGREGEIYNLGGAQPIDLLEAIGILADELGVEPLLEHEPARLGDQRDTRADTTKARLHFGYQPSVGPHDGLRRQAAWHAQRRTAADRAQTV